MRWRILVALQLLALAVLGAVTVARFHVWAAIDESAHYAYVQSVAEDGRLPRIDDLVSPRVQAITDNTWPRPSGTDPRDAGLIGRSYEAFQPPLYYLAATPAYLLGGDHRDKVFALRAFDLLLVLAAAAVLFALARRTLPEAPPVPFAGGLLVLLWPGVLVRAVTVSNLALELLVASAFLLALAAADRRRDPRRLLVCGVLLGAALLTKLTLVYLALPFAVVVLRTWRRSPRAAAAAVLAPALLLAPWLASNLVRFGSLTANAAARAQQEPVLNPTGRDYGLGDLPGGLWRLTEGVLPQEWAGQLDVAWVRAATLLLLAILLAGAVAFAATASARLLRLAGLAVLGALAVAVAVLLAADWDVFLLRYFYAVLPALAVGVAAAAYRCLAPRLVAGLVVAQLALLAALWVDGAGAFYFTDLGGRLGI